MSDMVVNADGIEKALSAVFSEFAHLESEEIRKAVRASGRKCVSDLKETSPRLSGEYADGWRMKEEGDSLEGHSVRIYNYEKPGLTHLLEKGHAKRGGGRTSAIPHIEPAYERAVADLKGRLS